MKLSAHTCHHKHHDLFDIIMVRKSRALGVRGQDQRPLDGLGPVHTPNIAFRHLPPNSARTGYTTEGTLFISTQLPTDAVSVLQKVWVQIRLWEQHTVEARRKISGASAPGETSVSIQTILV